MIFKNFQFLFLTLSGNNIYTLLPRIIKLIFNIHIAISQRHYSIPHYAFNTDAVFHGNSVDIIVKMSA